MMALCNRLYDASEQVNSYRYVRFSVPANAGTAAAGSVLFAGIGLYAVLVAVSTRTMPAVLTAILIAGVQAYFGLSFPWWVNGLLFGLPALKIVAGQAGRRAIMPCMVCMMAVALLVMAVCPGVDVMTEQLSEAVRDRLGVMDERDATAGLDLPPDYMETKHENKRDLQDGNDEAAAAQQYRLMTVEEQQIAQPHWIDYLRIILLCLLIPLVLAAPFIPFVWMNKRAKTTQEKRAALKAREPETVITGAFRLINGYLDACNIGSSTGLYRDRLNVCEVLPEDYEELYRRCATLWQETVYSTHTMAEADREQMLMLLTRTEQWLYDQTDRRTRFRLKYIDCLHE